MGKKTLVAYTNCTPARPDRHTFDRRAKSRYRALHLHAVLTSPMKRAIWSALKKIAAAFAKVVSGIILTIVYFILITPYALVINSFHDLLNLKKKAGWEKRTPYVPTLKNTSAQ